MNQCHELLFLNPILQDGINVTVRQGGKWFKKANVGDSVIIFRTGQVMEGLDLGRGEIIGLALLPCNMIPTEWLALEHDSSCRNQHGLSKAMKRAYPDFKPDDLVTVIIFDNNTKPN